MGNERPRLHALTSLRWFAALLVFLRHFDDVTRYTLGGVAEHGMRQGVQGVAFFFVLSGFVLTWSSNDLGRTTRRGALSFWRRRFARIYPPYVVACLFGLAYALTQHVDIGLRHLAPFTLLQSFSPRRDVQFALSAVLWSLSAEAFFYIVFPFLLPRLAHLRLVHRRCLLLGCAAAPIAIAAVLQPKPLTNAIWLAYIFPPVRALEFVAGMLLGLELRERTLPSIDIRLGAAVAIGAYVAAGFLPEYFMWVGFAPAAALVLIATVAQRELAGGVRWLRIKPLVFLGDVSFCFYLVHLTVFQFLLANTTQVPTAVLGLPISLALATALHFSVERPFERVLRAPNRAAADYASTKPR